MVLNVTKYKIVKERASERVFFLFRIEKVAFIIVLSKFLLMFHEIRYNRPCKGSKSMYRVIEMYGDFEPWWFIEGWEEDIIASKRFDNYYTALKYYKSCWFAIEEKTPLYKSRGDLMTIFWDPKDKRWCDDCDEFLQQYHSLVLLEDGQVIPDEKFRPGYEKQTGHESHRSCCVKKERTTFE